MKLRLPRTIFLAMVVMSAIFVISACNSGDGARSSGSEGDFVLNTYTGSSEIGGTSVAFDELVANEDRPILLNFWASNCPPCRAEMPALEAAWHEYGNEVLFIGVDVGPYVGLGTYNGGRDFVEELGITYPTGNTLNRSVITDWQVTNMPSTFLLNRDGRVHDIVIGAISRSRLSQKIQDLIATNNG
jgi:thiol-disulfide isomerase/thioredoxin